MGAAPCRKPVNQTECVGATLLRLGVCIEPGVVIPCVSQVLHRATEIPATLEVHAKLGRDVRSLICVMPEQLFSSPAVQQHPALRH